jgi:hypothetical protein
MAKVLSPAASLIFVGVGGMEIDKFSVISYQSSVRAEARQFLVQAEN